MPLVTPVLSATIDAVSMIQMLLLHDRSLVAIPLLTLAVVASPGLGHWLKSNSTLASTRGIQGSKRLLIEAGSTGGRKQHVELDMRHRGAIFG